MDKIVRNNFKIIREKLGITQKQMASFLNLEQSSISKFESGDREISVDNIEKACNLFGISIHSIYGAIENVNLISPSFRKTGNDINTLKEIAEINKIAMNLLQMNEMLGESDD